MFWKDLVLTKFKNGFRILNEKNLDDKFFVIDDVKLNIGDEFRVGPNGYFEHIGNPNKLIENFSPWLQIFFIIIFIFKILRFSKTKN